MNANIRWEETPSLCARSIKTVLGTVKIRRGRFEGGRSEGVEVVEINTGAVIIAVLPTRGMGIWKMYASGIEFGWQSPVPGPVHPTFVPLSDPSGLGWLEGFDELLVRCGLQSNGAADVDSSGVVHFPLHGRIANLPATNLTVQIEAETGRVTLAGEVVEAQFLIKRLRLVSRISVFAGSPTVQIEDEVTNDLSTPATAQLLYHINVGAPLLSAGAEFFAQPECSSQKMNSHAQKHPNGQRLERLKHSFANACTSPSCGVAAMASRPRVYVLQMATAASD